MNKQTIMNSYYNRKTNISCIERFCEAYPLYSSKLPLIPEFLKDTSSKKESKTTKTREDSSPEMSVVQTVSLVSGFSRVKTDDMLCKEILRKRKDHKVFSKLEKDDLKERKWYFIEDSTKNIKGPFNAEEMDQFFQIHKINPQTKIKRKLEDHDYFFLSVLVKRYYKSVLVQKFNLETKNLEISNKLKRFKKGEVKFIKLKNREKFDPVCREERTLSLLTRPNLIYLNDMLPEDSDDDEEDEHCYSRLRSQTLFK